MAVRRLPVLQSSGESEPERPVWHWVVIGAGFVFTLWLPLSAIAVGVAPQLVAAVVGSSEPSAAQRFERSASGAARLALVAASLGPVLLSFFVAGVLGGALTGYFGRGTRRAHWLGSGALSATVAWSLALIGGALSPWPVAVASLIVLGALGALFTALGGAWGRRRSRRGPAPHT